MGKVFAVVIVLVFALSACAAKAEPETLPDVVEPAPVAAPEPEPVPEEPDPGLLNYKEWCEYHPEDAPPFNIELDLDMLVFSNVLDDGYTQTGVMFPRQWPSKQLGDSIPEYTGTGYMQEFFIVHPNMSLRTEDIQSIKVSVYRYRNEDIDEYINNLSGFTPDEEMAEEYYRDNIESYPYIKSVQTFRKDGVVLNIILAEDVIEEYLNSGKFVQFEVIYSRESYMFDTDAAEPTELLNISEYAKEMEFEVPDGIDLDDLVDTFDGSGMHYNMFFVPSKWPREAFGDLLPAYTGFGFLHKYEITTPQDDISPENALLVSVYIAPGNIADIETYIRRVVDFGYYEVPPEEYSEYEKGLANERDWIRVFSLPGHTCMISAFIDAGLPTLDVTLYFNGRLKNFFAAQTSSEEQGARQRIA